MVLLRLLPTMQVSYLDEALATPALTDALAGPRDDPAKAKYRQGEDFSLARQLSHASMTQTGALAIWLGVTGDPPEKSINKTTKSK
jgi:hypothetical protein